MKSLIPGILSRKVGEARRKSSECTDGPSRSAGEQDAEPTAPPQALVLTLPTRSGSPSAGLQPPIGEFSPPRRDNALGGGLPCLSLPTGHTHADYIMDSLTTPVNAQHARKVVIPKWARSFGVDDSASCVSPVAHTPKSVPLKWAPQVFVQSWHRGLDDFHDFQFLEVLGEGGFASVFLVEHNRTKVRYACKKIERGFDAPAEKAMLKKEVDTLKMLDHPNVIRLVLTQEDSQALYLLFDVCEGGELLDLIVEGALPEWKAGIFARQMFSALAYCHSLGVIHRDVKPENFLLENDDPNCQSLKLVDFGLCTRLRLHKPVESYTSLLSGSVGAQGLSSLEGFTHSFISQHSATLMASYMDAEGGQVGSVPYMAPELLSRLADGSDLVPTPVSDCWSVGVIVFLMLTCRFPFGDGDGGHHTHQLLSRIKAECGEIVSNEALASASPLAKDLLSGLLCEDPKLRWPARKCVDHEWVRTNRDATPGSGRSAGAVQDDTPVRRVPAQAYAHRIAEALEEWSSKPTLQRIFLSAIARSAESGQLTYARETFEDIQAFARGRLTVKKLARILVVWMQHDESERSDPPTPDHCPLPYPPATAPKQKSVSGLNLRSKAKKLLALSRKRLGSSGTKRHVNPSASRLNVPLNPRVFTSSPSLGDFAEESEETSFGQTSITPDIMYKQAEAELYSICKAVDASGDGLVDFSLWVAALSGSALVTEERMQQVFGIFDYIGKGVITPESLHSILSPGWTSGFGVSTCKFVTLIEMYDADHDGGLNYAEFVRVVSWE
mmetsp:Transcript_38218/g.85682  ORF Transcript_38218/g.85682 Transcript_38218/m.85682 type:complete len:782 (-) Transcript_38218:78-2423(-)